MVLTERARADRRLLCLDGGRPRLRGEVVLLETHTHSGNLIVICGRRHRDPPLMFRMRPK